MRLILWLGSPTSVCLLVSVFFLLFPARPLLSASDKAATFRVTLKIRAKPLKTPEASAVKIDRRVCGEQRQPLTIVQGSEGGLGNVVVWLDGANQPTWSKTPSKKAQIRSEKCEFIPRVSIISPGESVGFLSDDPVLHEIRSLGKRNAPVFRVQPPNLKLVKIELNEPEIVPFVCDLHPWSRAYVVVAPHPLYAVTDREGRTELENVPKGTYSLRIWHEVLGQIDRSETVVVENKNLKLLVDLDLPDQQ